MVQFLQLKIATFRLDVNLADFKKHVSGMSWYKTINQISSLSILFVQNRARPFLRDNYCVL